MWCHIIQENVGKGPQESRCNLSVDLCKNSGTFLKMPEELLVVNFIAINVFGSFVMKLDLADPNLAGFRSNSANTMHFCWTSFLDLLILLLVTSGTSTNRETESSWRRYVISVVLRECETCNLKIFWETLFGTYQVLLAYFLLCRVWRCRRRKLRVIPISRCRDIIKNVLILRHFGN